MSDMGDMGGRLESDRPDDCRPDDVAAYALGALEPVEARAVERHLESCTVCGAELAGYRPVVDAVATSPERIAASGDLRRRIRDAVAEDVRRAAPPARARRSRVPLGFAGLAFGTGLAFAVAAIVVVVIALPGKMANRTVIAEVTGPGSAALQVASDHSQLVVRHIPAARRGMVYEVWLQRGNRRPTPAGALFGVDRDGDASVEVAGSLYGVTHVLVTLEPDGGTRTPTNPAVINAQL